jgi:hypothetical protein
MEKIEAQFPTGIRISVLDVKGNQSIAVGDIVIHFNTFFIERIFWDLR